MRIDPDLPHLAAAIRTALDEDSSAAAPPHEPEPATLDVDGALRGLRSRSALVLGAETAAPELAAAVLTDACAERLALEAERLRTKRRMIAALADAPVDPAERVRADELAQRYRAVLDAQRFVRDLVERLRLHGTRPAAAPRRA